MNLGLLEDSESEEEDSTVALGFALVGTDEAEALRGRRRAVTRQYLTRSELLPDPRIGTPWYILYTSRNDRAYVTTMGFNVATFDYILESGFADAWNNTAIPRERSTGNSQPRQGGRSLDAAGALGLTLQYLSSSILYSSLEQIFAIIPSTVSRYLHFTLAILLGIIRNLPEAAISWPTPAEFADYNQLIVQRHPRLTGASGSLDGLKLLAQTSSDPRMENATYSGWGHGHFEVSVLAFNPRGVCIAAVFNAPGSWHDSRVARPIYHLLRDNTPEGYYFVADTAFPRGTRDVGRRIKAPLKADARLPVNPEERRELLAFNRQLLSYRQTAEWGMRALQGSFGRLRVPLDIEDVEGRANLVELCFRLHNVRTNLVGINEIRNVYEPLWRNGDDELWFDFENIIFSDLRRRDRVAQFFRLQQD